jgi:hypothetical protein
MIHDTGARTRIGPCRCSLCENERAGNVSSLPSDIYCAVCGHGYFDLRTGRPDDARMGCHKCWAIGQFVKVKPSLEALS